jgi:cysteate synthase
VSGMSSSKVFGEFTTSTPGATRNYVIVCSACGWRQDDDGLILDCPASHPSALLRTEYANTRFSPHSERKGLFRYQEWLPVVGSHAEVGGTAVYRSQGLARVLGLRNLWIAFNGYWPERDAALETATFKELEAYTVLGRLPDGQVILTVASSGNTGAAFAWACSRRQVPCLIVVPEKSMHRFRFRAPLHPCVKLVAIVGGDYPDAIELAAAVSRMPYFHAEGGVKNVGRRDGLATVLLAAFEEMQCLPTHYFQAVGSGTGAIAVLEAALRLIESSDCGAVIPRLMLCQNLPFTPIYEAWSMSRKSLIGGPAERFREALRRVYADELTNWTPPYEIRGGVYDALMASRGDVIVADNAAVRMAMDMFRELEGIDIEPAAGVALACLRDAVGHGKVSAESTVLLNVTGGGRLRLGNDHSLIQAEADLRLAKDLLSVAEAVDQVAALCASTELAR